jgi:hypothetical protein
MYKRRIYMEIKTIEFDEELFKKNLEENDFSSREDEELSLEDIEQIKKDLKLTEEDESNGDN